MELLCYGSPKEKVCLRFYPCKNVRDGKNWWDDWHKHEPLTVYVSDYIKLLLGKYLTIRNPLNQNEQPEDSVDVCSWNWIITKNRHKIITPIKNDIYFNINNEQEKQFYIMFVEWIEHQLEWADTIVVDGNQ